MIRMTILALAATFALPTFAGGPVITEEAAPPAVQRPDSDIGGLVVPLLMLVVIGGIIASQGDNCTDEPVTPTEPPVTDRCR